MTFFTGDMLAAGIPFVLMAAGVLAAVYQMFVNRKDTIPTTIEVDPDIRIRVTGKIS